MLQHLSSVKDWLNAVRDNKRLTIGRRLSWRERRGWSAVASEVRLRKTLILAAAKDLARGIDDTKKECDTTLLKCEVGDAPEPVCAPAPKKGSADRDCSNVVRGFDPFESVPPNMLAMAATDVFVEKAQRKLGQRARLLALLGTVIAGAAAGSLLLSAWYMKGLNFERTFHLTELEYAKHYNQVLTLILVRAVTISALFLGGVYLLVMIARALLHESMVLFGRRHSLRFERLYVYAKLGHVNFEDMQRAFGWTSEHGSAFADIKGERVSKTLVHTIADVAKEVAKSTATAISEGSKAKSGKS